MPVITATLSFRMPELAVSLVSKGPHLDVAIDPHVLVAGVKDVRIDDQSVVDRQTRIANIELGDGLEFKNKKLNIKGGVVQRITVDAEPGIESYLTPDELAALLANPQNGLVYDSTIYYPSVRDGNVTIYSTTRVGARYNTINVNTSTGAFIIGYEIAPTLEDHINDTDIHITAIERLKWNNKVSAEVVAEDEETNNHKLILRRG